MSKNLTLKETRPSYEQKSACSDLACFLTATAKVPFLEERLGTRLCFHPNLRFFYYLLSLKSFGYS